MKLLVIGATAGIGALVTQEAQRRGHSVRAFGRSADKLEPTATLEPWVGDATKASDLAPALEGVDAVVMTLGIRESIAMLWQPVTLFSAATSALVPLMEQHGPDRLIAVTGIGAGDSHAALSTAERLGHKILLSKPYDDKTRQEDIIRASRLRWTLVRPTILTSNAASRRYRVMEEPAQWRMGMISRADVADYIVTAVGDDSTIGKAPVLAR